MSLPWKKTKATRISRFMSEFQQSSKRGVSLIVETGFPTSLIDLFFKNRDHLKKSPSKRFQRLERQIQTAPNASSLINQDTILEKPQSKQAVGGKIEKVNFVRSGSKAEKKQVNQNSGCVCVFGGGRNGACVLMAFKILIVAVLALSTKKKLTIGITLSAFALLLTELVAARVFTSSKLCKNVKDKNPISRGKIETLDDSKECSGEENKSISSLEKTENSNLKDLKIRDLLLEDEKSTSKSSRLKSKIVKKLRSYKKSKKTMKVKEDTETQVSSLVSEDKSEIIESHRDEKESNPPLIRSAGDKTSGMALIVIVLTTLLCGKILAIVLTLACLVLRFGVGQKSDICL